MKLFFRDYSADERKAMAASGEAMADGSFPIKTRKDVENAVHDWGRAGSKPAVKAHIKKRAKALGAEDALPDDWDDGGGKARMSEFELVDITEPRVEGESVIRTGKFFECGTEFTDMHGRKFGISEAEADALLPAASEGYLNVEHAPSFLDGLMGSIRRYWRDGKDILAEYAINKHLHALTEGRPIKVSSEWDAQTKRPLGAAFVLHPAVKDAVMLTAFSTFTAQFGASHMQRLHDLSADYGAECGGTRYFHERAEFITPDELKALQDVHDHCAKNGADCNAYQTRKGMYYSRPQASAQPDRKVAAKMSFLEGLKALFRKAGVPEDEIATALKDAPEVKLETASADFSQHPEVVAMKKQVEEQAALINRQSEQVTAMLAQQQEDRKLAQFKQDSVSVASLKRERKLTPAEADEYLTLAKDNPTAFAATLPLLQKREPLAQFSGPMLRAQNPWQEGSQDAGQQLVKMAEEKAKKDGISMQAALIAVGQEQHGLAAAHKADVKNGKGEDA